MGIESTKSLNGSRRAFNVVALQELNDFEGSSFVSEQVNEMKEQQQLATCQMCLRRMS